MSKFGNLGQIRYNYALYESIGAKCSYDMIAIVSFLMYGMPAVEKMTEKAGLDPVSGKQENQIMKIAQYLVKMSKKIKLRSIPYRNIHKHLADYPEYREFRSIIGKIAKQMKTFMFIINPIESGDWETVCGALTKKAFKDNIYVHE